MYDSNHYIRITGNVFRGFDKLRANQEVIDYYYNKYICVKEESEEVAADDNVASVNDVNDTNKDTDIVEIDNIDIFNMHVDNVIKLITSGNFGKNERAKEVKELFGGKGCNDDSVNDISLCNALIAAAKYVAKTTSKEYIIKVADAAFRKSKLYRPKWNERRGNVTYGALTLEEAYKKCKVTKTRTDTGFVYLTEKGHPVRKSLDNFKYFLNKKGYEIKYNVVKRKLEVYVNKKLDDKLSSSKDVLFSRLIDEDKKMNINYDLNAELIKNMINLIQIENEYNPAAVYFEKCKKKYIEKNDGTNYLNKLLDCMILNEELDYYIKNNEKSIFFLSALKKWFVSCVLMQSNTENYDTNVKSEMMLVLRSKTQNVGKSYLVEHLLPSALYTECHKFNVADKDKVYQATCAAICELPEFADSLRDADGMKQFITTSVDVLRRPYDRSETTFPRRTNFVGTLNDDRFLYDQTGNRRFVILDIVDIDWKKYDELDKEMLWGYIAVEAEKFKDVHLTREELAEINRVNDTKRVTSDVEQRMLDKLDYSINENLWVHLSSSEIADIIYNQNAPANAARDVGLFLSGNFEKLNLKRTKSGKKVKYRVPFKV